MTLVNVSMFSPASGPDLANADREAIGAAIMNAFGMRPFVAENQQTSNPQAVKPSEVNAWLAAHGAARWRLYFYPPRQFELVEVKTCKDGMCGGCEACRVEFDRETAYWEERAREEHEGEP